MKDRVSKPQQYNERHTKQDPRKADTCYDHVTNITMKDHKLVDSGQSVMREVYDKQMMDMYQNIHIDHITGQTAQENKARTLSRTNVTLLLVLILLQLLLYCY